jgi:hypothetical protein
MKKQLLLAGAILLSAAAFSQTRENPKSEHGTQVRTVAKTETGETQSHGTAVSAVASSKSQGSAETRAERAILRSERRQMKEEQKASGRSHEDVSADPKHVEGDRRTSERSHDGVSIEGRTRGMSHGTDARKGPKAGVKTGVKAGAGADVKLSRPNIRGNSRLNAGARIL